jgi:hypothetical protein
MPGKNTETPWVLAAETAARYGKLPQVEAVALAGSQTAGTAICVEGMSSQATFSMCLTQATYDKCRR